MWFDSFHLFIFMHVLFLLLFVQLERKRELDFWFRIQILCSNFTWFYKIVKIFIMVGYTLHLNVRSFIHSVGSDWMDGTKPKSQTYIDWDLFRIHTRKIEQYYSMLFNFFYLWLGRIQNDSINSINYFIRVILLSSRFPYE